MLVESRGLQSDSTCILEAEPGKLDIKTQTWYYIYQFTLFTCGVIIEFRVDSMSLTMSLKKCNIMMA